MGAAANSGETGLPEKAKIAQRSAHSFTKPRWKGYTFNDCDDNNSEDEEKEEAYIPPVFPKLDSQTQPISWEDSVKYYSMALPSL